MGVGLLLIWRGSKLRIGGIKVMSQAAPVQHCRLLQDLKKELSQLEADLSRGLITRKEFDSTSKALLQALDRAVARVS